MQKGNPMNQKKQVRSSGIFLLELMLAIFFFSLASAVCVQIFVKAHVLSNDSKLLHYAVNECCNRAELISTTTDIDLSNLQDEYFDADLIPCSFSDGAYRLKVTTSDTSSSESPSTIRVNLCFERMTDASSIYSLDVICHFAQEVQP